ncbi:MAG: arylsulfatase A-like enzyme, partial [Verrucomicrobiales bacterium]
MIKHYFLLCVVLIISTATSESADDEKAVRPNVVVVITDDQGYGDLGCHGNEIIKTPNLDKLHSESTRLTNFHVSPTCAPTRAALMTGRYANATGVWHTIMGRSILRRDEATIGRIFADAGYTTSMFGKWHLGDNLPSRPEDVGFQHVVRHGGGG